MQLPKRKAGKYAVDATEKDFVMSETKYQEIKQELEKLQVRRPKASAEVSRLAELGDFSENVEYQLAKRRLRGILNRILILENQLRHAEVVKPTTTKTVQCGSVVTIVRNGQEKTYTILGALEADPTQGIISHNSPLGVMLCGKKQGDIFVFRDANFEIQNIASIS